MLWESIRRSPSFCWGKCFACRVWFVVCVGTGWDITMPSDLSNNPAAFPQQHHYSIFSRTYLSCRKFSQFTENRFKRHIATYINQDWGGKCFRRNPPKIQTIMKCNRYKTEKIYPKECPNVPCQMFKCAAQILVLG